MLTSRFDLPTEKFAFGLESQGLPVSLPEGAVRCKVRERASEFTRLYIKFEDGRVESWIACIRPIDGQDTLCPYLIQGANSHATKEAV